MLTARRVIARFKTAEILTKTWVLGIRRTWLKLMSPSIQDWDDVVKAFRQLELFLENLTDEVFYTRRGPNAGTPTMTKGAEVAKQIRQLQLMVDSAKGKAQHWQRVDEGTTGMPGTFKKEDGEHMLRLYRSDFSEATTESLEARGKWKNVKLTDALDPILKALRADAQVILDHDEKNSETPFEDISVYKQFDLNGMKVVVDDRTATPGEIKQYIKYLDETYERMKQKGVAKAWYGTVFIRCQDCGGTNPYGDDLGVGGDYRIGPDTVQVYSRPGRFIVELMAHELGHRYWYKQMGQAQRLKFESLVKIEGKEPLIEDARLVSPMDVQYAHKALEDAYEPLRKLLKEFRTSRIKWWPDLLKRFEEPMSQAASKAWDDDITAMQKVDSWRADNAEVKQLHQDALKAAGEVRKTFWDMRQDIKAAVDAVPDPTTPIPDLDLYWPTVFKPIQADWIETATQVLEAAVTSAMIYVDTSVSLHNEAEKARVKKQRDDWEEAKRQDQRGVLPVSGYGGKSISEAWAEVFAYYVIDRELNRDQLESFKSVLKTAAERVSLKFRLGCFMREVCG